MRTILKMADEDEVGDSSRDVLSNIRKAAKDLIRITLQCRVNAKQVEEQVIGGTELPSLVALKREKERLLRECLSCTVELELREQLASDPLENASLSDDYQTMGALRESIQALEEELLSVKSHHHQDTLLLECLQESQLLTEHLFPGHGTGTERDITLRSLVAKQTLLASELLEDTHELQQMQSELVGIERERIEKQWNCRQLMGKIEAAKEQAALQSTEGTQNSCDRVTSEAVLLRHTLQSVIVGSGVNWAGEEDLLQLMINLGNKFDWQ